MNTCYVVRSSRPAGLFSFGLLDGLSVRLRRPYLREAPAGFGLECLATAFKNNQGYPCTFTRTRIGFPTATQSMRYSSCLGGSVRV